MSYYLRGHTFMCSCYAYPVQPYNNLACYFSDTSSRSTELLPWRRLEHGYDQSVAHSTGNIAQYRNNTGHSGLPSTQPAVKKADSLPSVII